MSFKTLCGSLLVLLGMACSAARAAEGSAAADFYRKLTDGTIASQKPDGQGIVASMNGARIDEAGVVRWNETCYCDTPLAHERQTVYDHHFADLATEESGEVSELPGQSFMDYLTELARPSE